MLVEQIMQRAMVTVARVATLADALSLLRTRGIRHLLVVEDDRLVGIVSDRDLKRPTPADTAELGDRLARVTVSEIMTRPVLTVPPRSTVEDAARLLVREKISALPVTLGDRLLGIVTETDVLRLFVQALGAAEPSSRIDVKLGPDRTDLAEVVRVVESVGVGISSILTLVGPDGGREAVIRIPTINPAPVVRALEAKGYSVPVRGSTDA